MINFNGELLFFENVKLSAQNRGFKYGDAIFETVKVLKGKIVFWEDHYFRLMASMRMLRMKIPIEFTLEFLEKEVLKTVLAQKVSDSFRVRLTVYRKDGGFYFPNTNSVDYLIEVKENNYLEKEVYSIDVYKDFYHFSGVLSTIKTTNRMLNVVASIFANENDLDNCVLLNERKGVAEVLNGNIFIIKGTVVKTPSLTEGCIRGVVRKKVIEIIKKSNEFTIEETSISPFEVQKSDEVFITNSIVGIQPVTRYKKREFKKEITREFVEKIQLLEMLQA